MREIKFRVWEYEFDIPKMIYQNKESLRVFFSSYSTTNLMQYTGLKDKNGKEIYEGDILLWEGGPSLVKWNYRYLVNVRDYSEPLEIIGNIYENLELWESL